MWRILNFLSKVHSRIWNSEVEEFWYQRLVDRLDVLDINIRYFEGYTKQEIFSEVRARVSDYLLNITRRDKLPKSDIVYILEEIDGIDAVNVRFISETEETARRLGYYESKTVSVVPQEPVVLEDIGNGKQKYIFFKFIVFTQQFNRFLNKYITIIGM